MSRTFAVTPDVRPLAALAQALAATGKRLPSAQALVLNRITTRARQKVIPALTEQIGLPKRGVAKAVRTLRASPKTLRAGLVSRGGELTFRYFLAREDGPGVTATVKGHRVFVPGGFRRSGIAPNRYLVRRLDREVYVNPSRKWRGKIDMQRTGVWIPEEMIAGASRAAFDAVVDRELPNEISKELAKALPGAARR